MSRLPGSKPASAASAASSRRTSLASLSESVEMAGERSEDDGECGSWGRVSEVLARGHSRGGVLAKTAEDVAGATGSGAAGDGREQ